MEYPEKIGPYRIENRLGTGGMGTVYQAYDERLRRRVALKQVHPERATRPDARERFLSEVRAVARLNHPSLIHIYDILETSEGDWIVMELAEGPSLASLLAAGPLAPDLVVQLAQEIAGGLAAAHEAGILHRDLKTENVVLTRDGRAKILDFGLAAPIGDAEPDHAEIDAAEIDAAELAVSPGKLAGTPRAMSPEQALGKRGDARSDLFALGVLLYELATGSSPFLGPGPAETLARVCHEAHHPAQDHADLPRQLSELIDRLLEKQPDARPAGATEVVEALEPMVRAVGEGGGASTAVPLTAVPESFTEAPAPTKPAEDVQPFQLRGERRQLTLLCCQLVGGALDPEVLFEVLPPFQTVVNEAIERYEGHLRDVQGHRF
ncbi:MAG: serine/threonine-protein kinase, partial [Acidobacteriota bacterium]